MIDFKSPSEIKKLVDLQVQDNGTKDSEILELCQTVLKYSVNTCKSKVHCDEYRHHSLYTTV